MTKFSGWKIAYALCAIYFLAVGVVYYGYAALLPAMIKDLGWSRGDASFGFSLLSVVSGLAAPLAAYSIRRIGARNTIIAGGGVSALGSVITYFTDTLLAYYFGVGIVIGLAVTFQSLVPGGQILANWFLRRRALTMGMFLSMGGFGAFIAAPAMAYLTEVTGGWREPWLVLAASGLAGSLVAYFFVRNHPDELGQHQDGVDASAPPLNTGAPVKKSQVYHTTHNWMTGEAMRTREFWVIIGAFTMATMGIGISTSQSLIFLVQDRGVDAILAASALGTVGLMGAAGRLSGGVLGDYFEPRLIMAAGLGLELSGMVLLNYSDDTVTLYAYAMLVGFGFGMAYLSLPTLIANYFSAHDYAKLVARAYLLIVPVSALGPVIAGYTRDLAQSYTFVFLGFAALSVLPVILLVLMRPPMPKSSTAVQ
ncbi:MAG: MFS transporter [Alphaproteobacteria bacterium]